MSEASGARPVVAGARTFEQFAEQTLPALMRFAGVLTGDRQLAEDVCQDVLVKAMRSWDRIAVLDRPEYYVRRMLVNEFISWRRKWARIVPTEQLTIGESSPTSAVGQQLVSVDHAARLTDRADLVDRLRRLPPKQRATIVLRFYEDLSIAEVADVLSCSEGTVRGYTSRALTSMKLDPADETAPGKPGADNRNARGFAR